jgi:hypothetical protein
VAPTERTVCVWQVSDCAIIQAGLGSRVLSDNVLAVRQTPPERSCPFDLFLWVPAALRPTGDHLPCAGDVAVDAGSGGGDTRTQFHLYSTSLSRSLLTSF